MPDPQLLLQFTYPRPPQLPQFVAAAHYICPYSNATRGNVEVKLVSNGKPVKH